MADLSHSFELQEGQAGQVGKHASNPQHVEKCLPVVVSTFPMPTALAAAAFSV
jgi:hypothetical protein